MTGPFGPAHAHANLSHRQAQEAGLTTSGTSGPPGNGSSSSVALAQSLGSRLKARTAGCGSTLYALTWKLSRTPAGRSFFLLRASAPRTSGIASTGWPTPTSTDALRAGQITPRPGMICLVAAAQSAGWATPKAEDAESTGFSAKRVASGKTPDNLHSQTKMLLAGWATPASRDYRTPNHKTYAERDGGSKGEQLQNQVAHTIPGASLNGSTAPTESAGLLNPNMSRWLQGIPPAWEDAAPQRKAK